jgi:alpha-1,3-mannosyl-glycoprotein beta-1,2-N-acetylglucosaminyltransferase
MWFRVYRGVRGLRRYDEALRAELAAAPLAASAEEAGNAVGDVRLQYDSQAAYERHAAHFGMLQEWRDGVPRGGYRGTVRARSSQVQMLLREITLLGH